MNTFNLVPREKTHFPVHARTHTENAIPYMGIVSRPLSKAGGAVFAFIRFLPRVRSYVDCQAALGTDDLVTVRAHLVIPLLLMHPADMVISVLLALKLLVAKHAGEALLIAMNGKAMLPEVLVSGEELLTRITAVLDSQSNVMLELHVRLVLLGKTE